MAYLEIMVKEQDAFNLIKKYSDYSSVRTGVISLSAPGVSALNAKHPGILKKYLDQEDEAMINKGVPVPITRVEDDKIYVDNGNIELLSFLDVRSMVNPEMKIVNLWKLFDVIRSGVVKTDETFDNLMSPITLDTNVNELFASTGKMRFRNKLWSLSGLGEDFKLKDFKFEDCPVIEKRFMTLKDLKVEGFYTQSRTASLIKEGSPTPYTAKFFYITPNMVSLLEKGRKVTMAAEKAYGGTDEQSYKLVNPLILPQGHVMKGTKNLKCPGTYPTALYNAAYSEYLYRKEQTE